MPAPRSLARGILAATLSTVLILPAAPALAGERAVEVRYNDLDLSSDAGAAQFSNRVSLAVKRVCGRADMRNIAERQDMERCRQDARARSSRDVALALENARNGSKLASNSNLTISRR